MIKVENVEVMGFESAIRGMRNPMNSWDKSDSEWKLLNVDEVEMYGFEGEYAYSIGENDLKLASKLSKAGTDHSKFLRMITVFIDITAPLYWWKEFDTYKVGTVANSCSTMHEIHNKELTFDDFSCEKLFPASMGVLNLNIKAFNKNRQMFLDTKDKEFWWQMIQLLPSSYNQKRTVMLNYQVLKNMYHARKSHKLDEWREFCKEIEDLPYFEELIKGE